MSMPFLSISRTSAACSQSGSDSTEYNFMISALILDLDGLPRLRFGVSDSVSEEDGELFFLGLSWRFGASVSTIGVFGFGWM